MLALAAQGLLQANPFWQRDGRGAQGHQLMVSGDADFTRTLV